MNMRETSISILYLLSTSRDCTYAVPAELPSSIGLSYIDPSRLLDSIVNYIENSYVKTMDGLLHGKFLNFG